MIIRLDLDLDDGAHAPELYVAAETSEEPEGVLPGGLSQRTPNGAPAALADWPLIVREIDEIDETRPGGDERSGREQLVLFPASHHVLPEEERARVISDIRDELEGRLRALRETGRPEEAARLSERVAADLEDFVDKGYCKGLENYSRAPRPDSALGALRSKNTPIGLASHPRINGRNQRPTAAAAAAAGLVVGVGQ